MKEVVWLEWWTRLSKVFMIQRPLTIINNNLHHETKDNKRWCSMHSIRYMIAYGLNKVIERLAHLCIMQFFLVWQNSSICRFNEILGCWESLEIGFQIRNTTIYRSEVRTVTFLNQVGVSLGFNCLRKHIGCYSEQNLIVRQVENRVCVFSPCESYLSL